MSTSLEDVAVGTPPVVDGDRRSSHAASSYLLVASTGGHLAQLHTLAARFDPAPAHRTWVTFDTPQSRSLLAGEDVRFVRYTSPRDWRNVGRNAAVAGRLLRTGRYEHVVSTGSAIALSFLPLARAFGVPVTYIESAARSAGPSVTGRVLERIPGLDMACQYHRWADGHWRYAGSIFDEFLPEEEPQRTEVRRVVVSLGTIPFSFRRLVDRMLSIVPSGVDVVWQTGATPVADTGVAASRELPQAELDEQLAASDVVVAHAGTGSALAAMRAGRYPILVPREQRHDEHIDDHQAQIAEELAARDLALHCPVDELDWDVITRAGNRRVRRAPEVPRIPLRA